jgi:IstB-like ATP binding protein
VRQHLIILDEFGYVPFSPTGAQLLFQFCAALHERVSVLITTNLPFSEWVQVLGDERLTSGLLDRLTFRCHILEFVGDSYRFQQALARQTASAQTASAQTASAQTASAQTASAQTASAQTASVAPPSVG